MPSPLFYAGLAAGGILAVRALSQGGRQRSPSADPLDALGTDAPDVVGTDEHGKPVPDHSQPPILVFDEESGDLVTSADSDISGEGTDVGGGVVVIEPDTSGFVSPVYRRDEVIRMHGELPGTTFVYFDERGHAYNDPPGAQIVAMNLWTARDFCQMGVAAEVFSDDRTIFDLCSRYNFDPEDPYAGIG